MSAGKRQARRLPRSRRRHPVQAHSSVGIHPPDEAIARRVAQLETSLADGFAAATAKRMAEVLHDAEADAHVLGDRNRLGRAAAYLTEAFRETGDLDRSRATGERAIVMAADLGDV